ncbi:MAG: type I glutamate--ammonia ligase [Oscillospiraceae bacterium]|nr:type I glutamate--ammonia ligase [Oscillospiraceae bacterium]
MFKTLDETLAFCKEKEIKMVDFMMLDLDGRWKHLTMPVERFTADTMKNGIGFDGSNYGYAPVENSDMVFIPDLSTAYVDSFSEVKTLSVIGDVYVISLPENKRFDQCPRNVATQAERYLLSTGIADEFRIGPEFEFHVFNYVSYSNMSYNTRFKVDTEPAEWNTGAEEFNLGYKLAKNNGYHAAPPLDKLNDFRSRVCMLFEQAGIAVKYHHHEVSGSGQIEIEVEFGGLREMADKTMLGKYIIKNRAILENKTATFMPKPIYGEAGNGLHVHMHLFKEGKPLFYDANGYSQLSETAHHFIGGILKHAKALCAFTNPSTNSYKRLVPGYEAPVTIGYATSNRSSVIRIPAYAKAPDQKRFELRNPDGTCNPYYAYSAILMAGIDGIKNKINPEAEGYGPYDFNLYNLNDEEKAKIRSLPRTLDEALDSLESDKDFLTAGGVFSEKLIEIWINKRRKDALKYSLMPHPVEYEMYFDL